MSGEEVTVFLMTLMILAGVAVLWMAMQSRRRIREMERMAEQSEAMRASNAGAWDEA